MNIIRKFLFNLKKKKALKAIESHLKDPISNVNRVEKIYGSKVNSFIIETKNSTKGFFLKFQPEKGTKKEIDGNMFLKNYLPSPDIVLSSEKDGWILFEKIHGKLFAESFLEHKENDGKNFFYEKEAEKEDALLSLYKKESREIDISTYKDLKANELFHKRVFGERYKKFYEKGKISAYLDHKIIINNEKFPYTVQEIINLIRSKYENPKHDSIDAFMGHGDAHHGNIITNESIWFIDNEYADYAPPLMELAKPYYNDFIGTLFFHHHELMERMFEVSNCTIGDQEIFLNIKYTGGLDMHLKTTEIKLDKRESICNQNSKDFLTLNDYLILCHMLTKNPNKYPPKVKVLFLAFVCILHEFNPFSPESIFNYLPEK